MKLTISDKFSDWCLNQRILELASQRNESIFRIRSLKNTLNEHLFKLYVYQTSIDRNHWKNEIYSHIRTIYGFDWGKKHKRFDIEDYYQWLYLDFFDKLSDRYFRKILQEYDKELLIDGWTLLEFKNLCERFYNLSIPMMIKGDLDEFDNIIDNIFDL